MYIPLGFMGTFGACITASVTPISGSGIVSSGSFISGSDVYDWMKFEMSSLTDTTLNSFTASLNIISGSVSNVNLLIVGGGAGGGSTGSIFPVGSTVVYGLEGASPGGGGGVVYYNNLTLSPGTYEIGVGSAAKRGVSGGTNNWTGSNGNDSYFTYNQPFPTFNNPKFIAYGGGYGGGLGYGGSIGNYYSLYTFGNFLNANNTAMNSTGKFIASAGGVVVTFGLGVGFPGNALFSPNGPNGTNGLGGFTGTNQGNASGYVQGGGYLDPGGYDGTYIAGAGGAGGQGQSLGSGSGNNQFIFGGNGGAGVTYNVANEPVLLAGGGAGRSPGAGQPSGAPPTSPSQGTGTRGSTSYGAGGNSFYFYSSGDTNSIGNAGLVYIEWKRCIDEKCKTFSIETASSPLTMSFVKCGDSVTSSLALNPFEEVTVCALSASGSPTFTSSPGSTIQVLGNCVTFENNTPTPVAVKYTFLRYDVDINCDESNPTQVWSLNNYADGLYLIGGTLYRLTPNTHTNYTIEITSATSSSCTPPPPPFPISGSLKIWSDTTTLTGSVWNDRSGNGNNGLVSGSALALTGSLGYAFNGTNNYVTYPITLTGQPTIAYTLQYYGSLPSESLNRDFFCKEVYTNGWDTLYRGGTDDFVFRDQAGQDRISPAITPTLGQKQLITITANSDSNVMQLYSNNTLLGTFSGTATNPFNAVSAPFVFGFNANGDATYWKGGVTALLLYNKVLDATEVSQSYAWMVDNY